MKLTIDTTHKDQVRLHINDEIYEITKENTRSQVLLLLLMNALDTKNATFSDITEIVVVHGAGSYTGIRVGFAIANAFSYILQIPVNGRYLHKGELPEITYE